MVAWIPYKTEGVKVIDKHKFLYHNADCFRIHVLEKLGHAQAIYYDLAALKVLQNNQKAGNP